MYLTSRNQTIDIYFREVRNNYSTLTREDEINLFARIATGDKKAGEEVFNRMAKMAIAFAKTYTGNADLLQDLIQEANIGILTAIDKYDVNAGYRFSTFARWWMKANITSFMDSMGIVPTLNPRLVQIIKKVKETYFRENGTEITDIELMDKLEEMGEIVTDINDINIISIDSYAGDDEDNTVADFGEFAEATASYNAYEEEIQNEDLSNEIAVRMKGLDSREKLFVRLKFGLDTGVEMEYESIADYWNKRNAKKLTAERVRQIVNEAIKKMK